MITEHNDRSSNGGGQAPIAHPRSGVTAILDDSDISIMDNDGNS